MAAIAAAAVRRCACPALRSTLTAQHRALPLNLPMRLPLRSAPQQRALSFMQRGGSYPLLRPTLFAATGVTGCFVAASWAEYRYPEWKRRQDDRRRILLAHSAHGSASFWDQICKGWAELSSFQRTLTVITAVNVGVFALWRLPMLQSFMCRYFVHRAHSGPLLSMVGANFSHRGLLHLGMNLFALWSFSRPAYEALGHNQFLGLFSAAVFSSSWLSHLHGVVARLPNGGLGLSGVVLGLAGATAMLYPDMKVALVFLPQIPFSAQEALGCLVAFDIVGVVFGWTMLGHAAHLGGTLFGVWYVMDGHKRFWANRDQLVVQPLKRALAVLGM
eukprot:m.488915 g.488915  ORF g.488915 m.488915 type:complete len:331 (-) comp26224_c0_seq1:36-1028(-)